MALGQALQRLNSAYGVNMMESDRSIRFSRACVITYRLYKFMLCTSASDHQKHPVDLTRPPQMDLKIASNSLKCVTLHAYGVPCHPGGHVWTVILLFQT